MICDLDQAAADSNTMCPTLASLSALSALVFGVYNYDCRILPLDNLLWRMLSFFGRGASEPEKNLESDWTMVFCCR